MLLTHPSAGLLLQAREHFHHETTSFSLSSLPFLPQYLRLALHHRQPSAPVVYSWAAFRPAEVIVGYSDPEQLYQNQSSHSRGKTTEPMRAPGQHKTNTSLGFC